MRRLIAVVVILALAGCHDHPGPKPAPTPSPSASATPTPGPTSPGPDPTSPSPSPASPSPSQSVGFPTAETAGVPAGTVLTAAGTCSVAAGQTVTGKRFTCDRVEMGKGATIVNSEVIGEVKGEQGFTIEHSTIRSGGCKGDAAIGNGNFTARYVELVGWGDGFRVEGGLGTTLIEHSYAKLCEDRGFHGDGLQVCPRSAGCGGEQDVSGLVFHHNRVSHPRADSTGAIFIMGGSAGGRVTDNLMGGFSITLRVHGSGYTVTGNRIADGSWLYGPVDCDGASSLTWSDNRLVTVDADGYRVTGLGAELHC